MEIQNITSEQIAATGATITIEPVSSTAWRESAKLASEIANNNEYQAKVFETVKAVRSLDVEEGAEAVTDLSEFVRKKFGNRPYFDSGVEHAAYLAVLNEIKKKK